MSLDYESVNFDELILRVHFGKGEEVEDEQFTGVGGFFRSGKTCCIYYDDTSMDKFRLNKDGTWRCFGTTHKRCKIEQVGRSNDQV